MELNNMKNLVVSLAAVAVGTASVQGALPGFPSDAPKPWSVEASLRGFYDDNVNTLPSNDAAKRGTFGFEVNPAVILAWSLEQTTIALNYMYTARWYDRKPVGNSDHWDQTHTFNGTLNHSFSERYKILVKDSFVIGQEPDILRAGGEGLATLQRIPGNNIRNYGTLEFNGQITPLFGVTVGYANAFYDYKDEGASFDDAGEVVPSRSGALDRIEHTLYLDTLWRVMPQTQGIFGYQYRQINYTGGEMIGELVTDDPSTLVFSKDRDSRQHYAYVGLNHSFRPDLTASVRGGARHVEYYNDPSGTGSSWGPYALASLRWTYLPESYLEAGVSHDLNATDVIGLTGNSFTTDEESTVVYLSLRHKITPKLSGNLNAQFQDSTFRGGSVDNASERYYLVGLSAEYRFAPNLSAEAGYSYDRVDSDISFRSFDRNRVYIGIKASY
jgi:hypothetical protein